MKNRNKFLITLLVLFIVFSAVYFLVSYSHVSDAVWLLMYFFTLVAFGGQIYFYHVSFCKDESIDSKVYGIPVFKVGIIYLVIQLVFTAIITVINIFVDPLVAVVVIVEIVLIGLAIIGLIAAESYKEHILHEEKEVIVNTSFMDNLKNEVKAFNNQFNYEPLKKAMDKLTDLIIYSDPVSNEKITIIEDEIGKVYILLKDTYFNKDYENLEKYINKLSYLVTERNVRCKSSK